MFNFLAIIGIIGFLVFLVLAVISLFKKNGKAKRNFGIAAGLFVLFLIGAINSPPVEEAPPEQNNEVVDEDQKEPDTEEEETNEEPSTVADIKDVIKKGMSDADFKAAKEDLNVESPKSISIGNGNVGYVLQATDGIIVANTNGQTITDVIQFASMDEVNNYESDMIAKAKVNAQENAKKEREASKIVLKGSGDTATQGFKLTSGWAIFDGSHQGSSNFIVHLQDENGNNLELLVNKIGSYKGKTFAEIPVDGNYYLNVKAGGSWSFNIYQTPPVDVPNVPTTLQGTGDDVVFFNAMSDTYRFEFSHQGQSNFIVLLNGADLMVNEIGTYNGSTRKKLGTDGVYGLVIKADGKWSAKVGK